MKCPMCGSEMKLKDREDTGKYIYENWVCPKCGYFYRITTLKVRKWNALDVVIEWK